MYPLIDIDATLAGLIESADKTASFAARFNLRAAAAVTIWTSVRNPTISSPAAYVYNTINYLVPGSCEDYRTGYYMASFTPQRTGRHQVAIKMCTCCM